MSDRGAILYYSLSGHTRRLAEAVAERTGGDLYPISAGRYRPTVVGYIKAGIDSLTGRLPEITAALPEVSDYDWIAVGGPVWTSYPSTPLRAMIAQLAPIRKRVGLFLTSGDAATQDKAFAMSETLLGREFTAKMSLGNSIEDKPEAADKVAAFCDRLSPSKPARAAE